VERGIYWPRSEPNGAGTSTLIKSSSALSPAVERRASVLGARRADETREIRKVVGYMPRERLPPPDVGATEICHAHGPNPPACREPPPRERTAEVLRHVGLYEERYRQIGGYSTGMKQRVKLAQALAHDPSCCSWTSRPTAWIRRAATRCGFSSSAQGPIFGISVVVHRTSWARSSRSARSCSRSTPATLKPPDLHLHSAHAGPGGRSRGRPDRAYAALKSRLKPGRKTVRAPRPGKRNLYDAVRDTRADLAAAGRVQQERRRLEDIFASPSRAGTGRRRLPVSAGNRLTASSPAGSISRPWLPPL